MVFGCDTLTMTVTWHVKRHISLCCLKNTAGNLCMRLPGAHRMPRWFSFRFFLFLPFARSLSGIFGGSKTLPAFPAPGWAIWTSEFKDIAAADKKKGKILFAIIRLIRIFRHYEDFGNPPFSLLFSQRQVSTATLLNIRRGAVAWVRPVRQRCTRGWLSMASRLRHPQAPDDTPSSNEGPYKLPFSFVSLHSCSESSEKWIIH